jgi:hypothetical protein
MASFIGAGISSIGSLIGAGLQSAAIKKAAGVQSNAATNNASLEKQATTAANTYTEGNLNQIQANEQPYQQAGGVALGELAQGTAAGGVFNSTPTAQQVLAQDPGYAFQLQQGTQALQRAEAAGGSVGSGGALKAGVAYSQNYADSAYNNAYNQFMGTRESNYNNLANIANYGQTANQVDATAGTQASGLVANTTLSGTQAQTSDLGQAANAQAAGIVGSANAWSSALGSIGTAAQQANAQYNLNQSGYQSSGTLGTNFNNMATGAGSQLMKAPIPLGSLGT